MSGKRKPQQQVKSVVATSVVHPISPNLIYDALSKSFVFLIVRKERRAG
jgi:hypothetical protein